MQCRGLATHHFSLAAASPPTVCLLPVPGQYEKAQTYFERALELPGTGLKRWRDKPPALSTGELTSALYNVGAALSADPNLQPEHGARHALTRVMQLGQCCQQPRRLRFALPPPPPLQIACCRSRLGDIENGLVAMAGAIEQGEHGGASLLSAVKLLAQAGAEPGARAGCPSVLSSAVLFHTSTHPLRMYANKQYATTPLCALPPLPPSVPQGTAAPTSSGSCAPTPTWRRCARTPASRASLPALSASSPRSLASWACSEAHGWHERRAARAGGEARAISLARSERNGIRPLQSPAAAAAAHQCGTCGAFCVESAATYTQLHKACQRPATAAEPSSASQVGSPARSACSGGVAARGKGGKQARGQLEQAGPLVGVPLLQLHP